MTGNRNQVHIGSTPLASRKTTSTMLSAAEEEHRREANGKRDDDPRELRLADQSLARDDALVARPVLAAKMAR